MTEKSAPKPSDKWIPWYFVLFFVVIALLDGTFVYMAVSTRTGTVTDHPYEEGITYNQTLAAAQAQAEQGWKADIELGPGDTLSVNLTDQDDKPLEKAAIKAKIIRPVQDGYDFEISLSEQGNGAYSAPVDFPLPGQWNVRIFAQWQDRHYQTSKTIITR